MKENFSNNKNKLWMNFWCLWMLVHSKLYSSWIHKNLSSDVCCFWVTKIFVVYGTFWCYLPGLKKDCTGVCYNGLGKKVEDQYVKPKIGRKSQRYVRNFLSPTKNLRRRLIVSVKVSLWNEIKAMEASASSLRRLLSHSNKRFCLCDVLLVRASVWRRLHLAALNKWQMKKWKNRC